MDSLPKLSILDDIHVGFDERHQFLGLASQPGQSAPFNFSVLPPCSGGGFIIVELGVLRASTGSSIDFPLASPQMEIFLCAFLPH